MAEELDEAPEHALITLTDMESGEEFPTMVPWASRHDSVGWGASDRYSWEGQDGPMHGVELYRGPKGCTFRCSAGKLHRIEHGKYKKFTPGKGKVLAKARAPLKAGQRWITVHPNGPDEKGVPILIQETKGGGSWTVVAGAGGKLTHLKLTGIKSEAEYKEQAKEKAKKKREKERERKEGQTEDERKEEGEKLTELKAKKLLAEREFLNKVRERHGGIVEDLDESKLQGLSSGARNLILSQHHAKQMRQAQERVRSITQELVDAEHDKAHAREELRKALEEQPAVAEEVQAMADQTLALMEQEAMERRAERRQRKTRQTSGRTKVGEKAAEAIEDAVDEAPDPTEQLKMLDNAMELKASDEKRKDALESLQRAKVLLKAAKDEQPDMESDAVKEAVRRAKVDPEDQEAVQDALQREAARQYRRHEVQKAQSETYRQIEVSDGEAAAHRALRFSRLVGGFAKEAGDAKRMGLASADKTPVQEAELDEMQETLEDLAVLKETVKAFQAAKRDVEAGKYKDTRNAFDITPKDIDPEKVATSVKEEMQRQLTEKLLGVANPKHEDYLQTVAAGHYSAMADVGLAIGGQRYIDRPTLDAIGVRNGTMLMRYALEGDGHKAGDVLQALEDHHVNTLESKTRDALQAVEEFVPTLPEAVEDVGTLEGALAQIDYHKADLAEAQKAVGAALGQMESTAAMGQAFREKLPDRMTIDAGKAGLQNTLQWVHAVGLSPGDYQVDYKNADIHIPKESWGKMLNRVPQEEMDRRKLSAEIKSGKHDEEGWLPEGIVSRESSTFTNPPAEAPRFFTDLDHSKGEEGVLDHVGSRLAEGEHPRTILSDLLAPSNVNAAPDRDAYLEQVRGMFPVVDEEGESAKFDRHREHFQGIADDYMQRVHGTDTGAFHSQDIGVDHPDTHEALFRSLAEHPDAVAAFTPTGQLSTEHSRALRDAFYDHMGLDPKVKQDDEAFRSAWAELGPEPDPNAGTMSIFGGGGPSPEWKSWARDRDEILERYPRAGLADGIASLGDPPAEGTQERADYDMKVEAWKRTAAESKTEWAKFVESHGSLELAQKAMQDVIKDRFIKSYADHHGKIRGEGLRLGVAEITNKERHVKATADEEQREAMRAEQRQMMDGLRDREQGRYASGGIKEKFTRLLEQQTVNQEAQSAMFTAQEVRGGERELPTPGQGERYSLGERAENQIASLIPSLGAQFEAGKKVGLFGGLNMDGDRVHQQRVIRQMGANGGRLGAYLGTGSGKSLTSIGAFTHFHGKGDTKHGLYLVPPAVQDQFGAEMLRFTEPGKYRWATGSGKSHEERVEMLRNPDLHMRVMTIHSYRDTALKLMADHHGRSLDEMKSDLVNAKPKQRAQWLREAFDANDIPQHFTYLDEGHLTTAREGGDPSSLHTIASAATHPTNSTHLMVGTATPHKNDESEVYSMASMLDPDRYHDRHQFMQNFGHELGLNPDAIRRELAHLTYSAKIPPSGVDRLDSSNPRVEQGKGGLFGDGGPAKKVGSDGPLELHPEHQKLVDQVVSHYDSARRARGNGGVDVEAIKALSPHRFEGQPESKHEAIARSINPHIGIVLQSAMRRAINQAPPEINTKLQRLTDVVQHDLTHGTYRKKDGTEGKGKPSIIFTDSAREAQMIHEHLSSKGVRSAMYHGGLTAQERESVRLGFQPEGDDEPQYDVVVATSAAEAGINMQRGKVIHHFDVPMTEKSHNQRSGRAYRQGQQGDVDVHDWHTDTDYERNARRRLKKKEGLASVFQTPIGSLDETGVAAEYHRVLANKHQASGST